MCIATSWLVLVSLGAPGFGLARAGPQIDASVLYDHCLPTPWLLEVIPKSPHVAHRWAEVTGPLAHDRCHKTVVTGLVSLDPCHNTVVVEPLAHDRWHTTVGTRPLSHDRCHKSRCCTTVVVELLS